MASNNSKYSQEVREETAKFIIESGKSATSVGEEMGIDKNTVCRWVRDYRRKYNLRRKRNFRKETKRCFSRCKKNKTIRKRFKKG